MTDYVTKKDVEDIVDKAVNRAVTELSEVIASFATDVDKRFTEVDMRLMKIEHRLDTVEARLDSHEKKFDTLLNSIDRLIDRIDRYETERTARDSQFQKLLAWARKVSEKTGIPLEDL